MSYHTLSCPFHSGSPAYETCIRGLLLPALSLVIVFLPVRPLWIASEKLNYGRLMWIPMTLWIVGWLVLVRAIFFHAHCFPSYQDTHAALLIASCNLGRNPHQVPCVVTALAHTIHCSTTVAATSRSIKRSHESVGEEMYAVS